MITYPPVILIEVRDTGPRFLTTFHRQKGYTQLSCSLTWSMPSAPLTRRQALRFTGIGAITVLAGCASGVSEAEIPTETSFPTATYAETESPTETPDPSPVTTDEFEFDAAVLQQFTDDHPARVRFSFTNAGDRTFVMSPRNLGPIVQDYVIEADSSTTKMVLVNGGSLVDPATHESVDPPSEAQNGCWTLDAEFLIPPNWSSAMLIQVRRSPMTTLVTRTGRTRTACQQVRISSPRTTTSVRARLVKVS